MTKILYAFIITILFVQCSPKTTEQAMDTADKGKTMVDNAFRKMAPAAGPAPTINIGKAKTFSLANGLDVIVVENKKIPQVSFQISLKNDPILEGDKVGYVAMAGDLIGRGTTTKTKAQIDEAIDFIGASFNSSSSGMYGSSLTKHTEALLETMADVLYNPAFPEEELEKIKKQTLSGLDANKSDPNAILSNVRSKVLYGAGHPYGEVQTPENVQNITLADTKKYYEDFFIPNNAFLIIVGDITNDKAKMLAEKYFGKWQRKAFKPIKHKSVPSPTSTQVFFANKDAAVQSAISIAYPIDLKPGTPDVIKTSVLNSILGGSFSSRLMQNLREDKAYTYGARSSLSSDELIGNFNAGASVRNIVTDSSITQFLYELERIKKEPVSEKELQSMKNYMTGGFARSLESPQTVARFAYNTAKYNLPADYYETYLQKLNAVTVADITAMAQKYIHPEAANIIVVGNKDEVAESLLQFDGDGQITYFDPYGNEVKYDATAIPDGVTANSIIDDYINAIGGAATVKSIKTLRTKMVGEIMGQNMILESFNAAPNKYAMTVGNGQMVFQEQVFDGSKAMLSAMGQKAIFTEGSEFDELSSNAMIIPQSQYATLGYLLELNSIEDIEGEKAYKITVTNPAGKKSTEFYSTTSSLLIRMVSVQEGPQGTVTTTIDLSDYKAVSGVLMPSTMKMSGMMPVPITLKADTIEVNGDIPTSKFEIKE